MLKVVFEDEYLMVLDKPPALVVTRSETQSQRTLEDILASSYGIDIDRAGIVHRLDKDTSGLIIVAKTQGALQTLQAQFKARIVKKQYLALVHGFLSKSGKVELNLARVPGEHKFMAVPEGKEAVTEYTPIKNLKLKIENFQKIFKNSKRAELKKLDQMRYNAFSLVDCQPKTGRTHQIRVHLKYLGFPVVGDDKYGGRKISRLDKLWCKRQFLHAARLEFVHPKTREKMVLESSLPKDLRDVLDSLDIVNGNH